MDSRLSYKFRDVGGAATIDGGGGGRTQLELVGKMPLLRETTITMSSSPLYTSHTTLVALASRRVGRVASRREVVCGGSAAAAASQS